MEVDVKRFTFRLFSKNLFLMVGSLLLLAACQTNPIDYQKISVFSPAEVKQDANFLLTVLNNIDVSAWEHISEKAFEKQLQNVTDNDFWLQNRLGVFRDFAPLIAALGETHSRLIYPQTLSHSDGFYDNSFPLLVLFEESGVFVAKDMSNKELIPAGARIIAINGLPIAEIIQNMSRFVAKETAAGQRRLIQVKFAQLLTRELGLKPPFKIAWSMGYLKTQSIYRNNNKIADLENKSMDHPFSSKPYGISYLENGIAILWLMDFESPPEIFREDLAIIFASLEKRGIDKLVIDLRYNSGGISENVLTLLSFLENKSVQWAKKITLKNSDEFRSLNRKRIKQAKKDKLGSKFSWLPLEYLSGWNWSLLFGGEGDVVEQQLQPQPVQPTAHRYQGALAVIANGHCFSACAFFVDYIQQTKRGIIVGEDVGSLVGIQFGYPVLLTLPNTGLQLMVPVAKIQNAEKAYKVIPDIEINRRQVDIANDRDPELAGAVSALIALTKE